MTAIQLSPSNGGRPGEELVHDDPPGVDVAAGVAPLALDLLGAHVVGGADALGEVLPGQPLGPLEQRRAEVGHLQLVVGGDQDVLGLEVAVGDAVAVEVGDDRGQLATPVDGQVDRHRAAELATSGVRRFSPSTNSSTR